MNEHERAEPRDPFPKIYCIWCGRPDDVLFGGLGSDQGVMYKCAKCGVCFQIVAELVDGDRDPAGGS